MSFEKFVQIKKRNALVVKTNFYALRFSGQQCYVFD